MNLTLDRSLLMDALHRCLPATDSKSPSPMADKVLLEAVSDENPRLLLSASSGTLSINTAMPVQTCTDPKPAIVVQAKKLHSLLGPLHGEHLTLKTVRGSHLVLQGTGKRKFELSFADPEQFPKLNEPDPNLPRIEIESEKLHALIKALRPISNNPDRPAVHGIQLHGDGTAITAVAMNGRMLSLKRIPHQTEFELFLPSTILVSILELLEHNPKLVFSVDGPMVYVETDIGDTLISTSLTYQPFPPWQDVMRSFQLVAQGTAQTSALQDMLKAILIARSGSEGAAKFTLKGSTLHIALNLAQLAASDSIELAGSGEFDLLFDPDLILEASRPCGEQVELLIDTTTNQTGVIQLLSPNSGYSAIVMGMHPTTQKGS